MKKIARLSIITFAFAIILTAAGGKMIYDAKVNVGDIYDIFEDSITFAENNAKFTKAAEADLTDMQDMTEGLVGSYQLNEFNTLAVYADNCTVKIVPTTADDIVFNIDATDMSEDNMTLQTAVKDGCLYVKHVWLSEPNAKASDVVVNIGIPDNYKGGYSINGSNAAFEISDLDSSTDVSFNLYDCTLKAQTVSGRDVLFEASGGSSSIEKIVSNNGFTVTGISSNITVLQIDAAYTVISANSATLDFRRITGSLTADVSMCSSSFSYLSVTGNVTVTASAGTTNIVIPHDSPVSLRHEESYSRFKDTVNWTDGNEKNTDSQYVIDTNVKFGIVNLSEK